MFNNTRIEQLIGDVERLRDRVNESAPYSYVTLFVKPLVEHLQEENKLLREYLGVEVVDTPAKREIRKIKK